MKTVIAFMIGVVLTGTFIMWSIGFERRVEIFHLKDLQQQAIDERTKYEEYNRIVRKF